MEYLQAIHTWTSLSFICQLFQQIDTAREALCQTLAVSIKSSQFISEGDFETLLDELRENAQYTNKVLGIELSKNKDEQFGEESINLLRELKNFEAKELHFKISFTFQENFPKLSDEPRGTESAGQNQIISHHISVGGLYATCRSR